jgi:pimeloyl-ACP methyl ester carboxylesterase
VSRGGVAFDRSGSGPPLVLLHPLGGDRRVWDPVVPRLRSAREVFAVDLPGFGDSPPLEDDRPPTPAALARAVAAALAARGHARFHVAGDSLGGWVALELGLAGTASTVTAIGPAGLWPEPLMPRRGSARAAARVALPALPLLLRSERARAAVLSTFVAHPERVPRAAAEHLVRAYAAAPDFEAVNDAMRANRFLGLADLRVPTTLAWPDHDRLVARPRVLPPTVRNVVLHDCGHLPTWDDPAQVAALLLEGSAR